MISASLRSHARWGGRGTVLPPGPLAGAVGNESRLRRQRNVLWTAFTLVLAFTVAAFYLAGTLVRCEPSAANDCNPALKSADVFLSVAGLAGVAALPFLLLFALRAQVRHRQAGRDEGGRDDSRGGPPDS